MRKVTVEPKGDASHADDPGLAEAARVPDAYKVVSQEEYVREAE